MTARELALSQPDLQPVTVDVPEWGGAVEVRPLDGYGFADLFAAGEAGAKDPVRLTVLSAYDPENGERMFTAEDIPALRRKPQLPFLRIAAAALTLNRLTEGVEGAGKG